MIRHWQGLLIAICISTTAAAQTLFTYGDRSVTLSDFMRAYEKNNVKVDGDRSMEVKEYLQLYINSRLKIREAYARGFDTLPQIVSEVNNLRNQIIENYMSDPATMDRLLAEVRERSLRDVHAAHIFFAISNGDTSAAFSKSQASLARLKKGEDFMKLAAEISDDPAARTNRGDLGWITVFTLPYIFENSVYSLKPGEISTAIRSKGGYHIFKNIAVRKALGKMKAKQILLAFPPDADEATRALTGKKADSLYKRIMAGDSFEKLAAAFSTDQLTAVNGGSMPDFGVGQFDPVFETRVWALRKDGAVSKPFKTAHGYHIVKRISVVPVVTDPADKQNEQALRQRINSDQRWKMSQDVIVERVLRESPYRRADYRDVALWAFTDSMLDRRPLGLGAGMDADQLLFEIGEWTVRAGDWITYSQAYRFRTDGSGRRPYEEVMKEFIDQTALRYYRGHLENFNDEFRFQMNEFRDGNLFFEIMQQEIWNRAHADTAELRALFGANRDKYNWGKSADAVIFFCADPEAAASLHAKVSKQPTKWKEYAEAQAEKVVADSSRFEWEQIPNKDRRVPTAGMVTTPLPNKTDNTTSFAYIINTYNRPMPRSFAEARGLVINDYQSILEEQWLKELRIKYPVVVYEDVLTGK